MIFPKIKKTKVNQFLNSSAPTFINQASAQKLQIGQKYNGGVIFHLWLDSAGAQHGLIVEDVAARGTTALSATTNAAANATSFIDGKDNTAKYITQNNTTSAAKTINDSTEANYDDWYLPAAHEMLMLYTNLYEVNKTLTNKITASTYWTSTEASDTNAYTFNTLTSSLASSAKNSTAYFIGIRSF